jgi:hypothetical protein
MNGLNASNDRPMGGLRSLTWLRKLILSYRGYIIAGLWVNHIFPRENSSNTFSNSCADHVCINQRPLGVDAPAPQRTKACWNSGVLIGIHGNIFRPSSSRSSMAGRMRHDRAKYIRYLVMAAVCTFYNCDTVTVMFTNRQAAQVQRIQLNENGQK